MSRYAKLTELERGGPLYVRKDMVAAVGSWLGKTYLVLTVDEVDYHVRETPEQVLRLIEGDSHEAKATGPRRPVRTPHLPSGRGEQGRTPTDSVSV